MPVKKLKKGEYYVEVLINNEGLFSFKVTAKDKAGMRRAKAVCAELAPSLKKINLMSAPVEF